MSHDGPKSSPAPEPTHGRRPRVGLFGEFGGGNLGNEASFEAGARWARAHDADVLGIGRVPEEIARTHHVDAVGLTGPRLASGRVPAPLRKLANGVFKLFDPLVLAGRLARTSVVLVPGTGILESELGGPAWGMPATLAMVAGLAHLVGRRFVLVSIGASPSQDAVVSWLRRRTLRQAWDVSCRDAGSRALVEDLAGRDDVALTPDIALSLDLPLARPRAEGPLRVGVGLLSYHNRTHQDGGVAQRDAYERTLAVLAAGLVAEGHSVTLLIGDSLDDPVAHRVLDQLSVLAPDAVDEGHVTYHRPQGWEELTRQVAELDVVVGSRYHVLLFAIMAGLPVVAAGYAEKFRELLTASGAGVVAGRVEQLTSESLRSALEDVLAHRAEHVAAALSFREWAHRASLENLDAVGARLGIVARAPSSDPDDERPVVSAGTR